MRESWTWHGGGLAAAQRHFGEGDRPWLDLSTGINPHAWPGVAALAIDWQRLPEQHALAELEAAAAAYIGVSPHHVCAVPGTEVALRLVGSMLDGRAAHVAPSYRTHGEMADGARPIPAACVDTEVDTLILANPNNPDGRLMSPDHLRALLDGRAEGAWLLVDEAFVDVDPDLSIAAEVGDDRALIVFRSFGKFFGLAGVRLGFVVGPAAILNKVRASLGAWPVSAGAIAIGLAAYRDVAWIKMMRARLIREAAAMDDVLATAGYQASGGCPLFRLVDVPDAAALFDRLARRQILTRPFADQPRWLRIGLPADGDALDRLAAALHHG